MVMVEALKKGSALAFLAANSWRMEWKRLFTLASSMLRIGLIGFGGGNALIPVIEAEVVRDKKLVTTAEYQEDIVAASITPGALPVEIAAGTGQRVAGALGMILAASMMALPGAALMVGILAFLSGDSAGAMTFIRYLSIPIGAFIMSLLFLYTVKTLRAEHAVTGGSWKMAAVITLTVFLLTDEADVYRLIGFGFVPFFGLSTLAVLGLSFFLILFLVNSRSKTRLAVAGMIFVLYVLSEGKSGILGGTWLAEILPILMAVLAGRAFFHSFGKSCIAPGTGRRFLAGGRGIEGTCRLADLLFAHSSSSARRISRACLLYRTRLFFLTDLIWRRRCLSDNCRWAVCRNRTFPSSSVFWPCRSARQCAAGVDSLQDFDRHWLFDGNCCRRSCDGAARSMCRIWR